MDHLGPGRVSFLSGRLPSWAQLRVVVVAPSDRLAYDEADWRDAIVVVEAGAIDLECLGGSRQRIVRGDLLWLSGLTLRALHNPGPEPAVLAAVSRRPEADQSTKSR
jgi:hypothetical protein